MNNKDARISPENSVIAFIDHQSGLLSNVQTIEPTLLKNNTLALSALAELHSIPVILTTSGSDGPNGPLMPELVVAHPGVKVLNRSLINAWDDVDFVGMIRETGRTHLILCGIVTDVCVAFPAIDAAKDGFHVQAVMDASGTWSKLLEDSAMHRMAQAGVVTTGWVAVAAELQRDWALPTGEALGGVLAQYLAPYRYVIDSFSTQSR